MSYGILNNEGTLLGSGTYNEGGGFSPAMTQDVIIMRQVPSRSLSTLLSSKIQSEKPVTSFSILYTWQALCFHRAPLNQTGCSDLTYTTAVRTAEPSSKEEQKFEGRNHKAYLPFAHASPTYIPAVPLLMYLFT